MKASKGPKKTDGNNNFDENYKKNSGSFFLGLTGSKDPNQNDENDEKNNFNENKKQLLGHKA